MSVKKLKFFFVACLSLVFTTSGIIVKADESHRLTVHHVDTYGAPITTDDIYYGSAGQNVSLTKRGGNY